MRSSFHRQSAAYLKERLVIFKEERVGGRARVTIDEEVTIDEDQYHLAALGEFKGSLITFTFGWLDRSTPCLNVKGTD